MPHTSRYLIAAAMAASLAAVAPARAAVPLGGLTVAVSESGDRLVAGGDTRTILVLDPKSLEVKARHWIGTTIVRMAFNKSGSILAVEDTSGSVYLYDTATWKAKFTLPKHNMMTVHTQSGVLAGVDNDYRGAIIHFNSLDNGGNLGQIQLARNERVSSIGFSTDGKRFGVLLQGVKSPDEKEVKYRDIPKELRGIARDDFQQRNDGRISIFRIYEVPSGKMISERKTFFTLNNGLLALDGDGISALGYSTNGARIMPDGNANLFRTKNSYNYGLALSPDRRLWLSGGLGSFSITTNPGLVPKAAGRLDRLPGWPEYFKGFSATADNLTIYGATTAYRIVKIGGDGKILKTAPVR